MAVPVGQVREAFSIFHAIHAIHDIHDAHAMVAGRPGFSESYPHRRRLPAGIGALYCLR